MRTILATLTIALIVQSPGFAQETGLYKVFEKSITNSNSYSNKFVDVELNTLFISPSGDTTKFWGFFDGDGQGEGNLTTGNVWKIRFMPNEIGEWKYSWKWSDGTTGGDGTFACSASNAGKGILKPFEGNPHWFAYNGTDPVWIKSYYESGHGSIAQPLDWLAENVYQPLIDNGYNHFMVNWLLSLCCYNQYYVDGPAQSDSNLTLYENGNASSTMRLDVWQMIERNVDWLNERNIGLFMFLGLNGGRNGGPDWARLSETEKTFYIKYVLARLSPFANIAGWNYTWEVEGDTENGELGCMRMIQQYDVFEHMRTYQDEKPKYNHFEKPEYTFAGVENHRINSDDREPQFWSAPWTHHEACKMGYVTGKPVYMVEGNALWRRYWANKIKKETGRTPTLDEVRQSAWACVTAGASFNWCGHQGEGNLMAYGEQGYPFHGDINEYAVSALHIDILTDVMTNNIEFHKMIPADQLLADHDSKKVWCLAEEGNQYLVFSTKGNSFSINLDPGTYASNFWLNASTRAGIEEPAFSQSGSEPRSFTPPDTLSDWALIIRKEGTLNLKQDSRLVSASIDTSGTKVLVSTNSPMIIPNDYSYGFKIKSEDSTEEYAISNVSVSTDNQSEIVISLTSKVLENEEVILSYSGTLTSTDDKILASVKELNIENHSTQKPEPEPEPALTISELDFSAYPNPFQNQFEVKSHKVIDYILVYNLSGKQVYSKSNIQSKTTSVSLKDLPDSIYIISINLQDETRVVRMLKQKLN